MDNRLLKKAMADIAARQEAVRKERDRIDMLINELSSLSDDCQEAWDHLENARDALSRLV